MATGPEHYREAEGLLASITDRDVLAAEITARMAVAQVHATLALAAATATNIMLQLPVTSDISKPWAQAIEPVPGQHP